MGKLRSMLLGAEKKRKQEGRDDVVEDQELQSATVSLRSHLPEIHDSGCNLENCKDLICQCIEMINDMRIKDQSLVSTTIRSQDDSSLDCDGEIDSLGTVSPLFEFQKAERAAQRCSQVVASRKTSHSGYGYRQQSTKVVVEVPDQKLVAYDVPVDTKQIDSGQPKDSGVQKFVSWEAEPHPIAESFVKPMLMIEKSIGQSASKTNFYAPYPIILHLAL
ncbi:uncharacterized protein [Solanum tuberosum]|uniref:uncharacterized protein n=1 Tax=Solanum tuberosum TaxID=4113 RepID=UPI00073A35EA|nr:PREDICTED: uncharacterized protein LOC107060833 [Solanum tuberosum]